MKTKLFSIIGLMALPVMAFCGDLPDFKSTDTNNDNKIDLKEFVDAVKKDANLKIDQNNDGKIEEDEFYRSEYAMYFDKNHDQKVTKEEFNEARMNAGKNEHMAMGNMDPTMMADNDDFERWDNNKDNVIEPDEYAMGSHNSKKFEKYDENNDGALTKGEYASLLFKRMDADNNGFLSQEEYKAKM